ncbi:MAG: DUF1624 domain-containing protein [Clostridiales bacterium]|nr:DUF1624 domain-containing protein [Clostridiales bacterium]
MTKAGEFLKNDIVMKKSRIWELDLIRGFLLILVTWDHIGIFGYCWNIIGASNAFGIWLREFMFKYLASGLRYGFEPVLIFTLVFLSGINCTFSRSHTKRAIEMLYFDIGFIFLHNMGTYVFPDTLMGETVFNILTIFAICFSIWAIIDYFKVDDIYLLIFGVCLTAIGLYFYILQRTDLSDFGALPDWMRNLFWLIYNDDAYIYSYNNFEPLLPGLGFFLLGGVYGRNIYRQKTSLLNKPCPKILKPTVWIGKHSLMVFIFGAPILVFIMWIMSLIKIL